MPKIITHDRKLRQKGSVDADLVDFFDLMRPLQLAGKLVCFLIQLPHKYSFNLEGTESFFKKLDSTFRYAVEFRHASWLRQETWKLLNDYDVVHVSVDEPLLPPEVYLTSDFAYFFYLQGKFGKGKEIGWLRPDYY